MKQIQVGMVAMFTLLCGSLFGQAQQTVSINANVAVPSLVSFSGVLTSNGKPITSITGVTFSLYAEQQGGTALWVETQNVAPDKSGHYSVMLGSTISQGLPASLFSSGEARWLGVQAQGEAEQPRVMLLSVPYAMKAGDAATVGGLPPSAFVLAPKSFATDSVAGNGPSNSAAGSLTPGSSTTITGSGKTDYVPLWLSSSTLGSSKLFQSAKGNMGIGTTKPAATLDVNGTVNAATGFNLDGKPFAYGSYAKENAFLGFAGNTSTTGTVNTASGYAALYSNTTGGGNSANGYAALLSNTTGQFNTAAGYYALAANTTGFYNTASGGSALTSNSTGNSNTASGLNALTSNTTGSSNSASGFGALSSNTTGSNNTADGNSAGATTDRSNVTGSNNTFFGSNTALSTGTLNNATAIGANAEVAASNALVLGSINGVNLGTANTNVGIGTTTPGATLDVEAPSGSAPTVNFGSISNPAALTVNGTGKFTGLITFASGQTFPGTGTVTSVGSGAGLTGGPITNSGMLSIGTGGVTNAMLANSSLTVNAGTALTGGGAVSLGGNTTLNVDTTKVPLLAASNTFTASQGVDGNLFASGEIGGQTAFFNSNSNSVPTLDVEQDGGGVGAYVTSGSGIGLLVGGSSYGLQASAAANGTAIYAGSSNGYGVSGFDSATSGFSTGVLGTSQSSSGYGVYGNASAASGLATGVYGESGSSAGIGVEGFSSNVGVIGIAVAGSNEGLSTCCTGVWGDVAGNPGTTTAVIGTADDNWSARFFNNSATHTTLSGQNDTTTSTAFVFKTIGSQFDGECTIDVQGDLHCTGTKSADVPVDGGARKVALYAVEAPENWFEDFGSGVLTNGRATVTLDPTFVQTVNTTLEYHVFLTAKGDSDGLYVSNETPQGFEVHEQHGGRSNIAFDYRIVAKRSGFENLRLADVTERYRQSAEERAQQLQNREKHPPLQPLTRPYTPPKPITPARPPLPVRAATRPLNAEHE